ncbi:unnamed protein product [Sordaria macrospora k-hell]|uniref:WGS project CABT00000000 data, contig 2.82 n=1 Tax=Sordaria macrospora (strain ATCC MYA-333 / DSM 997 / K(L3346) / K-hell) TaxID=771870 RepID=F7WBQ5_SORMK|nr:uncharacterized protein SMAC_08971 [Sordaria macrospora k-hell]KAH7635295.1 hypothetical protein B0T09DRAFT_21405 [Sordaria sp. MPI-SDFR-AT-0083]CCC05470.1 unnamed protein product [Sordaria macrospora k-hell]
MGDDSKTVEVSPTGDIILVVGSPDEKQLRLRVLSIILRSASKVFDRMFSPGWIESSRTFSPESPINIDLPEDDPDSMKTICYALHHRNDMIPFADMDGKHILQAVRVIDKYDMGTAMQLVTERWFRQVTFHRSSTDLMYLVAAAELLKRNEFFPKLTWLVMISHTGSYLSFYGDNLLMETLPPALLSMYSSENIPQRHSGKSIGFLY